MKKQKYLSKVINLYKKHGHIKMIVDQLEISEETIRTWLKDEGVYVRQEKYNTQKKQKLLAKVIKLYEKHDNAHIVAKKTDISVNTVKRWLQDEGIKVSNLPHPKHFPEHIKKKMRALYKKHGSAYKVGEILDVDHGSVYYWCKDLVPQNRKKRTFPKAMKKKAIAMRKKGMSYSEITKRLKGPYQPTIWLWCNS